MARPRSNKVYLYRPKLSAQWWARFTLPPNAARHFVAPDGITLRKPDASNRVSISLHTSSKREADERAADIQAQLNLAWKDTLNHETFSAITGKGLTARTLDEFYAEISKREQDRLKRWYQYPTPQERRAHEALDPHVVRRYELHRRYLKEALAALYPGETFFVHQFGLKERSRPHLLQIREWLIHVRNLEVETYKQLRSHFSGHWKHVAVANGYADTNPWEHRDMQPPDAVEKPRATLTHEQRETIMALPSSWSNNAVKLLLLTGCRPVELCWWMRSRYDDKSKMWTVTQSKVARDKKIPNTPEVAAVIADQLKWIEAHGLGDSLFLFPRYFGGKKGEQYERHLMTKSVTRALVGAVGGKSATSLPITPYTLRRTFASLEQQAKVGQHNLANLMGHKDTDQQRTYIQLDEEALFASAAAIQRKI